MTIKCTQTVNGRHTWRWEPLGKVSQSDMQESVQRCIYCRYFKGGKPKWLLGLSQLEVVNGEVAG